MPSPEAPDVVVVVVVGETHLHDIGLMVVLLWVALALVIGMIIVVVVVSPAATATSAASSVAAAAAFIVGVAELLEVHVVLGVVGA